MYQIYMPQAGAFPYANNVFVDMIVISSKGDVQQISQSVGMNVHACVYAWLAYARLAYATVCTHMDVHMGKQRTRTQRGHATYARTHAHTHTHTHTHKHTHTHTHTKATKPHTHTHKTCTTSLWYILPDIVTLDFNLFGWALGRASDFLQVE